ncbi:MAG TPA: S53 family peptidase [Streptosporangiaceae bacterium]
MTVTSPSEAASARGIPVPLTASVAPALPSGAVRLGSLAPGRKLTIEVALNVAHQAALTAFLNGLNDPRSPFYQQFLRPGQFGPRFGPSLAQVAAVSDALRSAGLSPGPVSANRLSIPVTASVAAIEHAFGITLDQYRMLGGRLAYANSAAPKLPAAVAPLVQGVLGLDDLYQWQRQSTGPLTAAPAAPLVSTKGKQQRGATPAAPSLGPQPCAAASSSLANTANTIASHYGLSLLYLVKDLGAGARIAVAELEPNLKSDIAAYEKCYGIKTKVNYLKVDSGVGTGAGQGEAALDIEILAALAPKSVIDVYQAPNTGDGKGEGFYDLFKKFAVADTDKVMSVSWGACEARLSAASIRAQGALFEQANAQGQTIFVASGDEGSTTCFDPAASKRDDRVSADAPATSPFVIAVGGTSFTGSGTAQKEVVWNDSNSAFGAGAGGGGVSTVWCMPNYQHLTKIPGLINSESKRDASKSCASKTFREIPDVAAAGDPLFGYATFYNGSWVFGGVGGTSAATPVWASIAALMNVSPYCKAYGTKAPLLPQNLYSAAATYHSYIYAKTSQVVRDVTIGNNDYTPSGYTGGLYKSGKGFDMASGLGVPMVSGEANHEWFVYLAGLTQVLCHNAATKLRTVKVTGVSPKSGPGGKAATVKVHGAGFLPFAFADKAQIRSGSKVLKTEYVTCTTTVCTVKLPAESARTVDIRIFALSLWPSKVTKADHYVYK